MSRRMFVALLPPPDVVESLERFLEPRLEADDTLRWSRPETWHVTLAFLPSVPERGLDRLCEALSDATRGGSFHLQLGGGMAFPDALRARTLAVEARVRHPPDAPGGRDPLGELALRVRSSAAHAGVEVDGQRFRAHLTLGRFRRPGNAVRWLQVLDTWTSRPFLVDEMSLVESQLGEGPGGTARHLVQESFSLS